MGDIWPDWVLSAENAGELASYVSPGETRGLLPANCQGPWLIPREGKQRARQLYDALSSHRIVYARQPWNPTSDAQRIRSPQETIRGPATCLDLSLVLAGMAIGADMRPLIALRYGSPHAAVILDVKTPVSAQSEGAAIPPWFTEDPADPGVWHFSPNAAASGTSGPDENWQIIDAALAARQLGGSFAAVLPDTGASFAHVGQVGEDFDQSFRPAEAWTLIDVIGVRKHREHYAPPLGPTVPAIYGYLPMFPTFKSYRSRAEAAEKLRDLVGPDKPASVIVLQAKSGYGKSMLAHQLALGADNGCGWVLNATDEKVLMRSLAQAERREKDLRASPPGRAAAYEWPDAGDDRARASEALDRLRHTEHPWVVVLDNCESPPGTQGLGGLMPRPRGTGQFVIITTTDERWCGYARENGWSVEQVTPLDEVDLNDLGLPAGVHDAVAGRPLVAEALDALRGEDVEMPERSAMAGADLVWSLLSRPESAPASAVRLARLLAWCPPEPMSLDSLLAIAAGDVHGGDANILASLSFVNLTAGLAPPAVQLHRQFAAAVRDQTWSQDPEAAADAITRLVTTAQGRECFITAADSGALIQLERTGSGEVARAEKEIGDAAAGALLWYGLGHIRERRGPVAKSGEHFVEALKYLDGARYPYEAAESLIGQARQVFQDSASTPAQLSAARDTVQEARSLLEPMADQEAQQLREQGNALIWLSTQKIVDRETNPVRRKAQLEEVREQLWLSYLERLRIARSAAAQISRTAPTSDDGMGAERAYYNLAGVNIQLAKTNHELATRAGQSTRSARDDGDALMGEAATALNEADKVYAIVRGLRELYYGGRAHPHLAACVQGQATVAYFRAVLLGDIGQLADALDYAAAALEQRKKVASGLAGADAARILRNGDVGKSIDFTIKLAVAVAFARQPTAAKGAEAALNSVREATVEWLGNTA